MQKSISINFNIPGTSVEDYDGVQPTWNYTPPIPVTPTYTGAVDCLGKNPLAMIIEQGSNDGAATLTPETLGRATWEYVLTSDSYSIAINCGSVWALMVMPIHLQKVATGYPIRKQYDLTYCVLS